jgi:hypothetical protein
MKITKQRLKEIIKEELETLRGYPQGSQSAHSPMINRELEAGLKLKDKLKLRRLYKSISSGKPPSMSDEEYKSVRKQDILQDPGASVELKAAVEQV